MILDKDGFISPTDDSEHRFYVYAWFCRNWGNVPFYVGKGSGVRYSSTENRSVQFKALIKRFDCFPLILLDNLSEQQAEYAEDKTKEMMLCEGMPLIDMEIKAKRKLAQRAGYEAMPVDERGRKISKKTGRGFGRQEKRPDNFVEVLSRQKAGEITVKEAMELAGVGRTRWYELAAELKTEKG